MFGLSAGLSPGPLTTLIISETLQKGKGAGFKIALAPLFTDGLLILASIFLFPTLLGFDNILGVISILGSIFLVYLAYESISIKEIKLEIKKSEESSLKKGIITNLLNPHPYVFYLLVGGPIIVSALKVRPLAAIAFIGGFLSLLVGTKFVLVLLIDKSKSFLNSKTYIYIMKLLGILLLLFGLGFFVEGLKLLKIY